MPTLAAFTALLLAPGLPLAFALALNGPRDRSGERSRIQAGALLYDALVAGLVIQLLVGLLLVRLGAFTVAAVLVATAAVTIGATGLLGFARNRLPTVQRPDLSVFTVGTAAVLASGLVLRRNPIEFMFMTGDMGEYVNRANLLAGGGGLVESFPHLFTVFLALPSLLFGSAHTTVGLPLAGLLLVGGVLRLGGVVGTPRVVVVVVALVATVGVTPVWFSIFPVSEALYGPLLLAMVVGLVRAHVEGRVALAAASGLLTLPLALSRGNALLLAPVLVIYLAVVSLRRERPRTDLAFTVAGLIGLAGGFAYNVEYLPNYFVNLQLNRFVPGPIFDTADRLGLLSAGPALAVATVVGIAATVGVSHAMRRVGRITSSRVTEAALRWAPALVVVAGAGAVLALGGASVRGGFLRFGLFLPALGALGFVLGGGATRHDVVRRLTLVAALLLSTFAILHAHRTSSDSFHAYHLYWDRYLYSEAYPAFLVAGLLGLGIAWSKLRARAPRPVTATAAIVGFALPFTLLGPTLHATRHQLFGDAHTFLERIDEAASPRTVPLVFHGYSEPPWGWDYPNTHRAVARPLALSFGRSVLNLPPPEASFDADPRPTLDDVHTLMRAHGLDRVFVVRTPAAGFGGDEHSHLVITPIDVVRHEIPTLQQVPERHRPPWQYASFTFEVVEARLR